MKQPITISAFVCFMLFACQRNSAPVASETPNLSAATPIEGIRWNLSRLPDFTGQLPEIARTVYIRLDSGKVTGFAGCNQLFGSYAISPDSLRFNPVGSTKKFCESGMNVETHLLQSLTLTNRYRHTQEQLQLFNDDSLLVEFRSEVK